MNAALPVLPASEGTGLHVPLGAVADFQDWPNLQRPAHLDLQQLLDALCVSPLASANVLEVARRCHATPYPPNWSEQLDTASGAIYFYHSTRDESSWQHPLCDTFREVMSLVGLFVAERMSLEVLSTRIEDALLEAQRRATEDLADWVGPVGSEEDGIYFYNSRTGQSEWQDPREQWQFDLQVRYHLLVGFLVGEERAMAKEHGPQGPSDALTSTLTSLASSLSSVVSVLDGALAAPAPAESSSSHHWAKPRVRRVGGLALPPRAVDNAVYTMPPHQQQYTSSVLRQRDDSAGTAVRPSSSGFIGGVQPPPPPPGAAPRIGA